jgi:N-methylhydantoinase A
MTEWPVYDRYALAPGAILEGPALIEERESTCVIGAGQTATVDARYNLVAELAS